LDVLVDTCAGSFEDWPVVGGLKASNMTGSLSDRAMGVRYDVEFS
jgi:hypothetical protein